MIAVRSVKNTFFLLLAVCLSCGSNIEKNKANAKATPKLSSTTTAVSAQPQLATNYLAKTTRIQPILGANRTAAYLPLLKGKKVGIVGNQSSLIANNPPKQTYTHLVDSLLSLDVNIIRVFSPEHGFRGKSDAGESVKDEKDEKTGLEVISLYGKNKKPTQKQLKDIDVLLFDIQDVGVRFYTYIATLHYVLEAAAELGIPVIVLDRPNPNGHFVDGPIMEKEHTSFLGMHAGVPIVHGMTIGEYANMMNYEGWLNNDLYCRLTVIPMENYNHAMPYSLPVRPSPNLPNDKAINLYTSLGLFEGTSINAGRGTEMQFQIFGSPDLPKDKYTFFYSPQPNFGSKTPKNLGERCYGLDLRNTPTLNYINLKWIINAYNDHQNKPAFFNTVNFTAHAGTALLQEQIEAGLTEEEIKSTWKQGLDSFMKMRKKHLIYPEK